MTQKMSSEFVRAQIEKSLELLASSAADQLKFLQREGGVPNADELALALDDLIVMLPATVRDGVISERQAAAIQQVSDFTGSFSGQENAPLWGVDQLGSASQWDEVEREARVAVYRNPRRIRGPRSPSSLLTLRFVAISSVMHSGA